MSNDKIESIEKVTAIPTEYVELNDRPVSDKEAGEAYNTFGLVTLANTEVRALAAIGINVKGAGVIRVQRGRVMVNQHRLDLTQRMLVETMQRLVEDIGPKANKKRAQMIVGDLTRLAQLVGYIAGKMTESGKLAAELEGMTVVSGAAIEDVNPSDRAPSFAPRAKIEPVHIHADKVMVVNQQPANGK